MTEKRCIGTVRIAEGDGAIGGIYLHGLQLADYLAENVCPESAEALRALVAGAAEDWTDRVPLGPVGAPA
jgi:hypothetical protein